MAKTNSAGLSHPGRVRQDNQDRWFADPRRGLFVVADGIGGHIRGDLAAQIVVDTLSNLVPERMADARDLSGKNSTDTLARILVDLNDRLRDEARKSGFPGMGSTVVLALILGEHALIAHMGDSRAYLSRNGELNCLTSDHSLAQLLVDAGEISLAELETHPAAGHLTRYVGMDGEALPEVRPVVLRGGDRLLLCTDGLTGMVADEQLLSLIAGKEASRMTCQRLVDAANEAGGRDNITAVIIGVESDDGATQTALS